MNEVQRKVGLTVVVVSTLCGLPASAIAQSGSLMLVPSGTTIDTTISSAMTLSVYGDADFGTHIAGAAFGLDGAGATQAVVDMDWVSVGWGQAGEIDRGYGPNGDYVGALMGQIIIPPFDLFPDPLSELGDSPVYLGYFQIELLSGSTGAVTYNTVLDVLNNYMLEIYDERDGSVTRVLGQGMGSAEINLIPMPSGLAVLELGGLVAGRRRR